MIHDVFHFVLDTGLRVAFAVLPATPLLGQKLPSTIVKNIVLVHGRADSNKFTTVTSEGVLNDICQGLPMEALAAKQALPIAKQA
jgi:hypothetical protein